MKTLNQYLTESKNTATVEIDGSPNWGFITPGVLETGEACVIIGEPCSRKKQEEWEFNYNVARKVVSGSLRHIDKNIDDAFKTIEQDMSEKLDEQECLCIVYLPEDGTLAVYTYQNGGVYAIK
ncbi:MAG: hypothetical protein J1F35_03730 [Erysipelotrichales bacterium]|nr:hypothetical protein [Erysipelotrichales bacterium]